jgi:oligopeptide/dipeptide ABC transporter ATP-binding protein
MEGKQRRLSTINGTVPSLLAMPEGCRFHPRCGFARELCRRSMPPLLADGRGAAACWAVTNFQIEAGAGELSVERA